MTDQFWLGVIAGSLTTLGLIVIWGSVRISNQRANALCRWCGGRRNEPVSVMGEACPSPFHSGHPDWDF